MRDYYVYIMANKNRTIYVGVTNSLERRVYEHKHKVYRGFTQKYGLNELVYHETFSDIRDAIAREKEIKGWRRSKKVALIESENPGWLDLSAGWYTLARPGTNQLVCLSDDRRNQSSQLLRLIRGPCAGTSR